MPLSRKTRTRLTDVATYAILVLGCILALAPIAWGLFTSFKVQSNIALYPPQWFPSPVSFEHYATLFSNSGFGRFFVNSLILSAGTILLTLFVAAPAAYAAARFEFRAKNGLLLTILATSMIPGISILIPIYLLAIRADLLNSYIFMILVYSAWLIPQAIWFIKGFIETVPRELDEAAHLDGCTVLGVFFRIVVPLIQPGLAAIAILTFIFVWNDFLIGAVLTTNEEMRTVQVGLVRFIQDTIGVWWGQFMAFAMLAIAPVLVVFLVLQRRFIEGLSAGGIKG